MILKNLFKKLDYFMKIQKIIMLKLILENNYQTIMKKIILKNS